jgi:hypothetical protein
VIATLALSLLLGGCASAPVVPAPTPTVAPAVTAEGRQRVEVTFTGGAVRGGVVRYAIPKGSAVELVVSSDVADQVHVHDVADQVHVHGYDRLSYVTAGASTTLRFTADLPGVFDVELEQRGAPLAQLQVS